MINGLVQDYSNSMAITLELLQSCTKPLIYQPFWSMLEVFQANMVNSMVANALAPYVTM